MTFYDDVAEFNKKFNLPTEGSHPLGKLDDDTLKYRVKFMIEELAEFCAAHGLRMVEASLWAARESADSEIPIHNRRVDLEKAGDALMDLTYVALGTAHFMGLPGNAMWAEVQRANMDKVRGEGASDPRSSRQHDLDVVKPEGWRAPDHAPLIEAARRRFFDR